jgi:hypothetical protein
MLRINDISVLHEIRSLLLTLNRKECNCNRLPNDGRRSQGGITIISGALKVDLSSPKLNFPQNYWIFGRCPSSTILKNTKEHNVSGTGSVSVVGHTYSFGSVGKS